MPSLPSLVPAAFACAAYLAVFGAAVRSALAAPAPVDTAICLVPALLALALGATSRSDRKQYVARLFAALLFAPVLLLMWASSEPAQGWHLGLLVPVHVAGLLLATLWLASFATRISAARGAARIGAAAFGRRMASMGGARPALFEVRPAGALAWDVDLRAGVAAGRSHRMTLVLDERAGAVRVREFLAADGARTRSESERSMRSPGDPAFDPTRPDAQSVWSRTWQSSMLDPARLAATSVEFRGDEVVFVLPEQPPVDDESCVALFALVSVLSGYDWSPRLLGTGADARRARASSGALD